MDQLAVVAIQQSSGARRERSFSSKGTQIFGQTAAPARPAIATLMPTVLLSGAFWNSGRCPLFAQSRGQRRRSDADTVVA